MAEHLKDVHRHWEGLRGEAPAGSDGKA
jgi:hypothetical protein